MKRLSVIAVLLCSIWAVSANAQLAIDTSEAVRPFNVGVRIGANTSNLSNNMLDVVPGIHSSAVDWKAGFTGGAVVDIVMRNFFALQPGIFFETRSDSFQRVTVIEGDATHMSVTEGDHSSSYLKIPVLASFRFLIGSDVEWQIEAGPYFSFGLGGNEKYSTLVAGQPATEQRYKRQYFGEDGLVKSYDWGIKMGMGLLFKPHWYAGIHYEAGCRNVLKSNAHSDNVLYPDLSGHNKAWDFTIGYNF